MEPLLPDSAGEYYAEAFGYDPVDDIPFKPQLLETGNPKLIDIEESKLSEEINLNWNQFRVSKVRRKW